MSWHDSPALPQRNSLRVVLMILLLASAGPVASQSLAISVGGQNPFEMPSFFSGTFCAASCYAGCGSPKITRLDLLIGNTIVQSQSYPVPVKIAQLGAVWDSTNFPDGTNIVLKARVTLVDFPDPFEQQREALIYNKAYLVGNVSPQVVPGGLGDLTEGYDAVTAVAARLAGTHHTLNPAANDRCKQQKPDITSALPPNTLFYLWSHGELGSFGDSAAFVNDPGGPRFPVHWLNDGEVSSILTDQTSGKGTQYPPYNFVFIDACETGGGMAMAMAFGIGMDPDRALMGFAFQMDDTQHNVNWSNRVFQKLAEGYILSSAIEWANANGGKAKDANGVDRDPTIHGDLDFKLRGVYPLDQSLIWFR